VGTSKKTAGPQGAASIANHMERKNSTMTVAILILWVSAALFCAGRCEAAFGVHVASFKEKAHAEALATSLEEKGCPAVIRDVSLPDLGNWHRVFAGIHEDRGEARQYGEALRKRGIIDEYSLLSVERDALNRIDTPPEAGFGILVCSFRDRERAEAMADRFQKKGCRARSVFVSLPGRGDWYRVFAGFYEDQNEAGKRAAELKKEGILEDYTVMELEGIPRGEPDAGGAAVHSRIQDEAKNGRAPAADTGDARARRRSEKTENCGGSSDDRGDAASGANADDARTQQRNVEETVGSEGSGDGRKTGSAGVDGDTMQAKRRDVGKPEDSVGSVKVKTGGKEQPDCPVEEEPMTAEDPVSVQSVDAAKNDTRSAPPGKTVEDSLLMEALSSFEAEKYETALKQFETILEDEDLDEDTKEIAIRRAADSFFQLSLGGDRRSVNSAIDRYREILRLYPDGVRGNDDILLRMAKGYESLGLYHEGLRELNRLCDDYPDSPLVPGAVYLRGLFYYRMQKFEKAVEELSQYTSEYPQGKDLRAALITLGDSYSQLGRFAEADEVFDRAIRMWPSLEAVPRQDLLTLGSHYMRSGNYERGLDIFLSWFNLYPEAPEAPEVLHGAGRILAVMDQVPAALSLLAMVVKRYPDTRQAMESIVIMADLGLRRPGQSLPCHIFDGMEYYRDPVSAFDEVMAQSEERERRDELLFLKANALVQLKRYREAFETARSLQEQSPWGPFRKETIHNLTDIAGHLVDNYHEDGNHLAAAEIFFEVRRFGFVGAADYESLFNAADSLVEVGLISAARFIYEGILSRCRPEKPAARAMVALAGIEFREKRYDEARTWAEEALKLASSSRSESARRASEIIGNIAFAEGDCEKAAGHFAAIADVEASPEEQRRIMMKYGHVLKALRHYSAAAVQYERALSIDAVDDADALHSSRAAREGLAECHFYRGNYEKSALLYRRLLETARNETETCWVRYRLGQSYARLPDADMAAQTFELLKNGSDGPFWKRVADYGQDYESFYAQYVRPDQAR
jgi:tetratricopeptide (TPR) repeat protein/cell division septation protein DedD